MTPAEVTALLDATRDDLVRDVQTWLVTARVRRFTPGELDTLGRLGLRHLQAAAAIGSRYEQARHAASSAPTVPPPPAPDLEDGWVTEQTPDRRPRSKRPRNR